MMQAQASATRERSDDFWRQLHIRGSEVELYATLESMALASDAVVLGHLVSVGAGRVFGDPEPLLADPTESQAHYATLTVEVTELLAGSLPPGQEDRISLEVLMRTSRDIDDISSSYPQEEAIFFLRSKGNEAARLGFPPSVVEQEQPFYRLVISHALLRVFDAQVEPALGAEESFLLELDGKRLADVLAENAGHRFPVDDVP